MAACLTKSEVASLEAQVRAEFERLLSHRLFAASPDAKQWQFFRHCFSVLMGDPDEHFQYDDGQIVHYKLEVSQRLERYYSELLDRRIDYFFRLEHVSRKQKFMEVSADYPACKNYILLVSPGVASEVEQQERRNILFRAVDDAVNAEFTAYRRLPETDLRPLEEFFDSDGPAYRRIRETIETHHRNGEIISNDGNPSMKALLDREVVLEEEGHAEGKSVEYWYLRWWSVTSGRYAPKVYKGKNRQLYILVKRGSRWLVWDNTYGRPRGSLP
jgi:hypothetical protein